MEIKKLKFDLESNQYPRDIIDKVVDEELKKRYGGGKEKTKKEGSATGTVEIKSKEFIVLPYANRKCDEFERKLTGVVKKNFPSVDFNVAFQSPSTIGDMFPFKDNIKKNEDKALVVYQLKCNECNASW